MDRGQRSVPWVVASAAVVGLAYASSLLIDRVGAIGPLDRAMLGGFITLPLIVAAPALGALAAREARGTRLRWLSMGTLGLLTLGIVSTVIALSTSRVGCEQISSPWRTLPGAAIVGLVAGVGLIVAADLGDTLGRRSSKHPAIATLLIGATVGVAAGLISLFAWHTLFGAVFCTSSG